MTFVVLAGPSGVGKDALVHKLREAHPGVFTRSVSHTTRAQRPGEKDGVDYHFVSKTKMIEMIALDELVECAEVHGNYYGTSKESVAAAQANGGIPLLILDVQGARNLHAQMEGGVFVFVKPPDMDELRRRLVERGTETQDEIEVRMKTAIVELAASKEPHWTATLVNDDFGQCFAELVAVVGKQPLVSRVALVPGEEE